MSLRESEFERSIRETEKNLASMKKQFKNKRNIYSPTKDGSISHDKRLSSPTNNFPMKSDSAGRAHYYNYFNNDLVSNLTKRLDEQSRTIVHISETMKLQSEDIFSMKQQIIEFQNKSQFWDLQNGGFNINRKFEMFQRQIRNELENLASELRRFEKGDIIYSGRSRYSDRSSNYHHQISKDLSIQRKMVEEETVAVHREIDQLKERIGKIESSSMKYVLEVEGFDERWNTMERSVSNLNDEQRRMFKKSEKKEKDLSYLKKELDDISCIVSEFHTRKYESNPTKEKGSKKNNNLFNAADNYTDQIEFSSLALVSSEECDNDSLHLTTTAPLSLSLHGDGLTEDFLVNDDTVVGKKTRVKDDNLLLEEGLSTKMDGFDLLEENDDGSLFGDYSGNFDNIDDEVSVEDNKASSEMFLSDMNPTAANVYSDNQPFFERKKLKENLSDSYHLYGDVQSDEVTFERFDNDNFSDEYGLNLSYDGS